MEGRQSLWEDEIEYRANNLSLANFNKMEILTIGKLWAHLRRSETRTQSQRFFEL